MHTPNHQAANPEVPEPCPRCRGTGTWRNWWGAIVLTLVGVLLAAYGIQGVRQSFAPGGNLNRLRRPVGASAFGVILAVGGLSMLRLDNCPVCRGRRLRGKSRRPEAATEDTASANTPVLSLTECDTCQACGYCLKGLVVGERCPECGLSIVEPRLIQVAKKAGIDPMLLADELPPSR